MAAPRAVRLLVVCCLLVYASAQVQQHDQSLGNPDHEVKLSWLSSFMPQKLLGFVPRSTENPECTAQGQLYKEHLENSTLWAVQMLDASVTAQVGVLTSSSYNFGSYDQCISISVPTHSLNGQYCLVKLSFAPEKSLYPEYYELPEGTVHKEPDPLSSVWNKIKKSADPRKKHRDSIHWAVCFPASCTPTDLQKSLTEDLLPLMRQHGIVGNISVDPDQCTTSSDIPQWGVVPYLFIGLLGFITFFCVVLTFYDLNIHSRTELKEGSSEKSWYYHFSMIRNAKSLLKSDMPKEFQILSGLKVVSMFIIIYGHRMLTTLYSPILNPEYHEQRYGDFLETINFNGSIIVNTFLVISGFLTYNKIIRDIEKKRGVNIIMYILYRWIRVTPIYLLIIGFCGFVLPYVPGGPLWKDEALWRHDACRNNWWSYILYINNYYKAGEECLIPSWYMAVDMQLYVVCVILGYILWKSRKLAHIILSILIIASVVIPILIVYQGQYDAIIKFYLNYLPNYFAEDDYINTYTRTHMRAAPYFIGMATAVVYNKLKGMKFIFTKTQMAIGTLIAGLAGLGSLLGAWVFFIPGREDNFLENGFYASVHRVAWALGISWAIIGHGTTGFGLMSSIIRHQFYNPFNKLTLCALLVHTPLQLYLFVKNRNSLYVDNWNVLWMAFGDILATYLIAFVLYLVIEAPMASIQDATLRILFGKRKPPPKNKPDPVITAEDCIQTDILTMIQQTLQEKNDTIITISK